jgi:hypothetical protein
VKDLHTKLAIINFAEVIIIMMKLITIDYIFLAIFIMYFIILHLAFVTINFVKSIIINFMMDFIIRTAKMKTVTSSGFIR